MGGEEPQRVTRIHHKGLLIGHLTEVFHHEAVLRPVLKDSTVSAVGDQLVRVLSYTRIEVVLNHQHDSRRLLRAMRIFIDGAGIHSVLRTVAIHIYASVLLEFFRKFGS